jgi:hypothetical protein
MDKAALGSSKPSEGVLKVAFTVPCRFFVEIDVTDCETIEGAIYQWSRLEAPSCLSVVGEPSEIVLEGDDSFPYEEFWEVAE